MEDNSKKYLTNPDGSYILKKDGTPRLRPGRPKNSELSDIKLALQAKNKLNKKSWPKQDCLDYFMARSYFVGISSWK